MNLYLAAKKSTFCVANLRNRPTIPCDERPESGFVRLQPVWTGIHRGLHRLLSSFI